MRVKELRPKQPVAEDFGQCQAVPMETQYNRIHQWRENRFGPRGKDPRKCQRNPTIEINGKRYCRLTRVSYCSTFFSGVK